ncbi:MAG: hypothetical protein GXP25_20500 [Planctomycetes bacterium]|nr:hypothetical protein [Planctomycetota bacterium]
MSDEPEFRPEDATGQKKSRCRLGILSMILLLLIAAVVYFLYLKRQDPTFRVVDIPRHIWTGTSREDPVTLGRKVTFFSISPLTAPYLPNGGHAPQGIRSTVYTKIGSIAVAAAGRLDLHLYEYDKRAPSGKGRQVYSWTDLKLPDSAEWGRWPLGGWKVSLAWNKCPKANTVWVEAVYTNPTGRMFVAGQGPIQISG